MRSLILHSDQEEKFFREVTHNILSIKRKANFLFQVRLLWTFEISLHKILLSGLQCQVHDILTLDGYINIWICSYTESDQYTMFLSRKLKERLDILLKWNYSGSAIWMWWGEHVCCSVYLKLGLINVQQWPFQIFTSKVWLLDLLSPGLWLWDCPLRQES